MIQKKIKQFYYPPMPENITKNILENTIAYKISIHALPGTKFSIKQISENSNTDIFTIGPTGNYNLDCSENPIKELYLKEIIEFNKTIMYPIIIDIEYLEVQENE